MGLKYLTSRRSVGRPGELFGHFISLVDQLTLTSGCTSILHSNHRDPLNSECVSSMDLHDRLPAVTGNSPAYLRTTLFRRLLSRARIAMYPSGCVSIKHP